MRAGIVIRHSRGRILFYTAGFRNRLKGSRPWDVLVNGLKTHLKKTHFSSFFAGPGLGPGPVKKDEKCMFLFNGFSSHYPARPQRHHPLQPISRPCSIEKYPSSPMASRYTRIFDADGSKSPRRWHDLKTTNVTRVSEKTGTTQLSVIGSRPLPPTSSMWAPWEP